MRPVALVLALLLAGCAAPEPAEPPTGPVDLDGRLGLFLIDTTTHQVQVLAESPALAWLSPNATIVSWTDAGFSIVLDRSTGVREVGQQVFWARVYENKTGLELATTQARWRSLPEGATLANATLPPPPIPNGRWSFASDDLTTLGTEALRSGGACANDIYLHAQANERTRGCHLRIAGDGRIGWIENGDLRLVSQDGAHTWINATDGASLENPVFSAAHVVHLRVGTGGTDVVDETGHEYATVTAPTRLALYDVSADGRYLLARAFQG